MRAGLFQVPSAPNSDILTFKTGGAVVEFEERHTVFDQPGKLRLGIFANRGNTGSYRNALAISAADPALDINNVMTDIQRQNFKYGFYVNAEQQLMKDVGLFARASWNDGRNQILSFTDIDRSVSAGLSVKGSYLGTAKRYIRFGRCNQRTFRRAPRFPGGRRPWPVDRRRPSQLQQPNESSRPTTLTRSTRTSPSPPITS